MSIETTQEFDLMLEEVQELHKKLDKLQDDFDTAVATIGQLLNTFGPLVENLQGSPIMKMLGL